jgi:hypothetical protein
MNDNHGMFCPFDHVSKFVYSGPVQLLTKISTSELREARASVYSRKTQRHPPPRLTIDGSVNGLLLE